MQITLKGKNETAEKIFTTLRTEDKGTDKNGLET
jgi:hypothetical protein